MNGQIIKFIQDVLKYDVSDEYYKHIELWTDWWRGYHKPFHQYVESDGINVPNKREMYTMKMAKKLSEDEATFLLNEKTLITLADSKANQFIQGKKGNGGVWKANNFWKQANRLVEKTAYSGTGAVVLSINNIEVGVLTGMTYASNNAKIKYSYVDANSIVPITVDNDEIIECAFVSKVTKKGKKYVYLQTHLLNGSENYVITNYYFTNENDTLTQAETPEGLMASLDTKSTVPMFYILKLNIESNIETNNGLGQSLFADALDNLKGVDLAYNNYMKDIILGQKKVFMNKSILQTVVGKDGKEYKYAPDDVNHQLFYYAGDQLPGDKPLIYEFNPTIRVEENSKAVQNQLDYLSFKVGYGTKHYQFNAGSIVTATQYTGDKQELMQHINKQYIEIESFITNLVRGTLHYANIFMMAGLNEDSEVTIVFDDSIIIDEQSRLSDMRNDVSMGLIDSIHYIMRKYGVDEATALSMKPQAVGKEEDGEEE